MPPNPRMPRMNDTPRYPGAQADAEWRSHVFPPDYANPEPAPRYNLVVVGAGPAGLVCAMAAAGLGAKVALVERRAMGGDCLNAGCVPSKALLSMARRAKAGEAVDFDAAMAWLRQVRAGIADHDSVARFSEAGVDVFLGDAAFVDAQTVAVGEARLRGSRFVIATGSRPAVPPVPGLAEVDYETNETVFDLRRQPERLAVLGAGPVGCELAQAFARLGSKVALLEAAPRVLPRDEPDAAAVLAEALAEDRVELHLNAKVERVIQEDGGYRLATAGGEALTADTLLVATGRTPNTQDLGLEAAGVETDDRGRVRVDDRLRTTNKRIFAAGDVCSALPLTHNADAQARIVLKNALFFGRARADQRTIPWVTYTDPEVAQIGPTEAESDAEGVDTDRLEVGWSELDRAQADSDTRGFARLRVKKGTDRVVAGTLVGSDAGEQIASVATLMQLGGRLGKLDPLVLAYPTRSEYLRRLVDAYNRSRLTPRTAAVLRRILAWRR